MAQLVKASALDAFGKKLNIHTKNLNYEFFWWYQTSEFALDKSN